jgi:hypothetical protein
MSLIDKNILDCCEIVNQLYDMPRGATGGLGHIVFDEGNLEDEDILFCLEDCKNYDNLQHYPIETILKSQDCLLKILELKYIERFFVYYERENYKMYT